MKTADSESAGQLQSTLLLASHRNSTEKFQLSRTTTTKMSSRSQNSFVYLVSDFFTILYGFNL